MHNASSFYRVSNIKHILGQMIMSGTGRSCPTLPKREYSSRTIASNYDIYDAYDIWLSKLNTLRLILIIRGWTRVLYSTKVKLFPWIPNFVVTFITTRALVEVRNRRIWHLYNITTSFKSDI